MASNQFPRQDIPESAKNKSWCTEHLDYAESILTQRLAEERRVTKMYNLYNGIVSNSSVDFLTKAYGKKNRTKFIDYRLGRPKINLIIGEWILRPLNQTVYTSNQSAKAAKVDQFNFLLGAMSASKELATLKENGVDVLGETKVPDASAEDPWEGIDLRSVNEKVMQVMTDDLTKSNELKEKIVDNWKDIVLASECHVKIFLDNKGNADFRYIDPRDAIYVFIPRDANCERSPIRGERRRMTNNEILNEFDLKDDQRTTLYEMQGQYNKSTSNTNSRNIFSTDGHEIVTEVLSIEWDSLTPIYTKVVKIAGYEDRYSRSDIGPEAYEKRKNQIDKDVAKGLYEIEKRWFKQTWEAHRIGNNLDVKCQRKEFVIRSEDNPSEILGSCYHSLVFNEIDGVKISLMETIENISMQYNIVMYQINKELAKAHGTVIVYDQAGLPRKKSVNDILYEAINDGIVQYNSAAAGNFSQKNLDVASALKQLDLGVSNSFPYLIQLKQDLERTLDRLTGINENREGMTKATMTATNAQDAIQASRSITEPMFFAMENWVEKLMMKMINLQKLSWGYNDSTKGNVILGQDGMSFLEATRDLLEDDYGCYFANSSKQLKLREKMMQLAEVSLNAKEIRYMDVIMAEASDTYAGAIEIVKKGWETVEKMRAEQSKQDQEFQIQMAEKQKQEVIDDREDRQAHAIQLAHINKGLDIQQDSLKAQNQSALEQQALGQQGGLGV